MDRKLEIDMDIRQGDEGGAVEHQVNQEHQDQLISFLNVMRLLIGVLFGVLLKFNFHMFIQKTNITKC